MSKTRNFQTLKIKKDGFFVIDFQQNHELLNDMENFIEEIIGIYDKNKSKVLLSLLHNPNIEFRLTINKSNSKLKLVSLVNQLNKPNFIQKSKIQNPI